MQDRFLRPPRRFPWWSRRIPMLLGSLLVVMFPVRASAIQPARFPRRAQYVIGVGGWNQAMLDTLARYDLLVMWEDPRIVDELRRRHPDIELYFHWLPQNITRWDENGTSWYPDTTWNLIRLSQFYATRNNWILRDIHRQPINEWGGYAANWTRYCPKGTYGTSKGLNYVEWLARVAIPQIVGGGTWEKWGRGSRAYDGIMLEVIVDCLGSIGWQNYQSADPDQDGVAEGVLHDCSLGGDQDSLSVSYREMNEIFYQEGLKPFLDRGVPILINGSHRMINPGWQTSLSGVKLETWSRKNHSWWTWWKWFYGLTGWVPGDVWGPGYKWAEDRVAHAGVDSLEGWDRTLLQYWPDQGTPDSTVQRMRRLGLGTTLLGNGYYIFTRDQAGLWWTPENNWDFGRALGGFFKEIYPVRTPADTLYVRLFSKGFAEVNPNSFRLHDVPAEDSRFAYWQTNATLAARATGSEEASISFTMPPASISSVEGAEVRYSRVPLTVNNWAEATPYAGGFLTAVPGERVEVILSGLEPATTYYCAIRNRVYGRFDVSLSPVASFSTDVPPTRLVGVYPNPVSPAKGAATVQYTLAENGRIRLAVYDSLGRKVRNLKDEVRTAGAHSAKWDGRDDAGHSLGSGVYHLRLTVGRQELDQEVVLIK